MDLYLAISDCFKLTIKEMVFILILLIFHFQMAMIPILHPVVFSKFYRRHFNLLSKYNIGRKTLPLCKAFRNLNFMATWFIYSEK